MKKRVLAAGMALSMLVGAAPSVLASQSPEEIDVMIWYRDIDDLNFSEMPYYNDPEIGITAQSGVKANFNQIKESDWSTKVNLMLTSGIYPDAIVRGGLNLEMYGVDQEILIPLDEYIDEYMPNYKALLEADPELADTLRSSDGKMYQIGWIIPQNINSDSHLFINKQWLDNLGLEVPTTMEEFEAVLRAFKEQDADGDGDPNNEIPLGGTMMTHNQNAILCMLRSWGIPFVYSNSYTSVDDEGNSYFQLTEDGMRPAMETLSAWYQDGLIDQECVSQDTNAFEAKVNAGNYGVFWRWRMTAMGTEEEVYNQYECILPPTVEGYETKIGKFSELPGFGAALTQAAVENGTVEAVCKWLDTQFEWENMINGYNGMKGEFWDYDEEGRVDIWPMSDGTRSVPGQSSMYYCCGSDYFEQVNMPSHRIEKTSYCNWYEEEGLLEKNAYSLYTLTTPTVEESTQLDLMTTEINKYCSEAIIGFLTNGVTDDSWDTYLSTLDSLQLNEYLKLRQDTLDRYFEANEK